LTLLISAGWVPPRLWFVAELPRPRHGRIGDADVHNVSEGSPPARDAAGLTDLITASLRGRRGYLPCDRPDESREFPRDRGRHLRLGLAARYEFPKARRQAELGLPGDITHRL